MKKKEIYSERLTTGNRTYFFDIKQTGRGDLYMKISERKHLSGEFESYRIMVFEEDFENFEKAIHQLVSKAKELTKIENEHTGKTYSIEKFREKHKYAYMPWTKEDDEKLELLYCEGKSVRELAFIFE